MVVDCFPPYLSIIGRIKNNIVSITGLLLDAATTKVFACSSKEKCRLKPTTGISFPTTTKSVGILSIMGWK
tara:strand:- start:305 stop:517 length:213 start_codon:yes stop_codon:yes gene_type:complete